MSETQETIFNLQDAAEYLKVHPRTLYRMIANPECSIPFQRTSPRGDYRFSKGALDAWLAADSRSNHTVPTACSNSINHKGDFCQVKNGANSEAEAVARGDVTAKRLA